MVIFQRISLTRLLACGLLKKHLRVVFNLALLGFALRFNCFFNFWFLFPCAYHILNISYGCDSTRDEAVEKVLTRLVPRGVWQYYSCQPFLTTVAHWAQFHYFLIGQRGHLKSPPCSWRTNKPSHAPTVDSCLRA